MTSAFYVISLEPARYKFQALAKLVSGQFASKWVHNLWAKENVYPAVAAIAMEWKSSCWLLQQVLRKLCFLPKPMGAGLDPFRRVRRSCSAERQATWYKFSRSRKRTVQLLDNSDLHPENRCVPPPSHATEQRWDFVRKPKQPQQHNASVREREVEFVGYAREGPVAVLPLRTQS